jgi:hypothetical protein
MLKIGSLSPVLDSRELKTEASFHQADSEFSAMSVFLIEILADAVQ